MDDYISNYTGAQIDNAIGIGLRKGAANGIASLNASGAGKPGCIIIYYRKKKELQSGPLVTSNNLGLLDPIGRRMIV